MRFLKRFYFNSQSPPWIYLFLIILVEMSSGNLFAKEAKKSLDPVRFIEYPNQKAATDFEIDLSRKDVSVTKVNGVRRIVFKVHGKYNLPEGNLLLNIHSQKSKIRRINIEAAGDFESEFLLPAEKVNLEVVSVNIYGEVQRKWYRIEVSNWIDLAAPERQSMSSSFNVGMGVSSVSYADSRISTYRQIALTAKLSFGKELLRKKMNLGLNAYFTALSLSKNQDPDVRYLGINARLGYLVPFVKYPWSLSIMGGIYYTTMFNSENSFGFQDMAGPQLYPVLRYFTSKSNNISFYGKFSPIGEKFSILSLSNREVAFGGSYQFELKNKHFVGVSIDYAKIDLEISGVQTHTNSITLGASYSF